MSSKHIQNQVTTLTRASHQDPDHGSQSAQVCSGGWEHRMRDHLSRKTTCPWSWPRGTPPAPSDTTPGVQPPPSCLRIITILFLAWKVCSLLNLLEIGFCLLAIGAGLPTSAVYILLTETWIVWDYWWLTSCWWWRDDARLEVRAWLSSDKIWPWYNCCQYLTLASLNSTDSLTDSLTLTTSNNNHCQLSIAMHNHSL